MSWLAPAPSVAASPGQIVFFDDFLGSSLDTSKWAVMSRDSDQSNSELNWYLPANVTVSGGNLNITCKVQSSNGRAYTSGMIQWQPDFNFRFGTVEFRAKLTGGQGPWPGSLWLLGSDCQVSNLTDPSNVGLCNWPALGSDEIDIAEVLSSDLLHVFQGIHSQGTNPGNSASLSDVSLNWHIYKLVWTASACTWFIDGAQTFTTSTVIPQRSMFAIVNVAVGGAGGAVTDGTLPQTMSIDYVKVIQG